MALHKNETPARRTAGGRNAKTENRPAAADIRVSSFDFRVSKLLLPHQQSWVNDPAPLKIYLKARQIGFSFAETLAEVIECVQRPRTAWLLLSRGERQALELARKAKEHCQAIGAVARLYENEIVAPVPPIGRDRHLPAGLKAGATSANLPGVSLAQHRLEFPNGSWMIALPANPDTARGYAANVLLDEFAFHRDARAIYAAVYPSITRGFKLRIGSTPFGESGMFYELWTGAQGRPGGFSKHRTDIFEARAQGLELDVEKLREGCPDEDIWRQEYCCEFISDATSWIPWELIIAAQSVDATIETRNSSLETRQPGADRVSSFESRVSDFFLGVDIARRRDLTVIYAVERIGDVLHTRAIERLANASFAEQQACIERSLFTLSGVEGSYVRRCALDSTGLGAMLAETLQQKFGSRVEAVHFTLGVKEDLAVRVKRLFEERRLRIPDDRELRSAIHAVRKYTTAAGHFRFDAERTERGHADEFWALALAAYAADAGPTAALAGRDSDPARGRFHVVGERAVAEGLPHAHPEEGRVGFFGLRGLLSSERAASHEEQSK